MDRRCAECGNVANERRLRRQRDEDGRLVDEWLCKSCDELAFDDADTYGRRKNDGIPDLFTVVESRVELFPPTSY